MFLLIEFCCGTPPSCLKVQGGGGGGLEQFSVSPRPLGFGFGTKGLGPGLDNKIGVDMDSGIWTSSMDWG